MSENPRACPPVLFTQIRVPSRARPFVARPRLVDRVGAAPVTLVCAPAGAGKTTLLVDWAEQAPHPVAWVSLEREDDAPYRFWRAVLESLRVAGVVPEGSPLAALEPPVTGSGEPFAPLLVNALAELPSPAVLVLDDAHLLRSRGVGEQLGFLLLHLPPTLRLALAARSDPSLPLHVLRVRTRLGEIRMRELAFTAAETAELLTAHELELGEASVAALHERTEGWAAGLRMAALSLQRVEDGERFVAEFAGDDRVVGDYLVAEILERMPARDRRFLLRTSVAGRLCGELAEAITGEPGGGETLERLARTNGFVLDHDGWFRYHTLFAELLRTRLRHGDPEDERACHRAAARWYAAHAMPREALRHAGSGQDAELAAGLVAGHWRELFAAGHRAWLREALDELPGERVDADPELSAAAACARFDRGQADRAREHLANARGAPSEALARVCAARHDGDVAGAEALLDGGAIAHLALGVALLWSLSFARAEEQLRHALADARAAGADYLALDALAHLALTRALSEGPAAAAAAAGEAAELARRSEWGETPAAAATHAALAHIALYESRVADAEAHWVDASKSASEPGLRFALDRLGALIRLADGRRGAELRDADHAAGAPDEAVLGAVRARLLIAGGDVEGATAILDVLPPSAEVAVVKARLALAGGAPHAAPAIDSPALLGATRVEAQGTGALVLDALGLRAEAVTRMEGALALAETTGHRTALSGHPGAAPLLHACIRAGTAHRSLAGELLQAIEDDDPARAAPAPLADPLTDREREVLDYLPSTASNRDIAASLGVTTNTVKTHLRGVYRKLDAADRRDAVSRARTHRLLSGS